MLYILKQYTNGREKYIKDVKIIESERSKLSTEKELKQLETALVKIGRAHV